MTMDSGRLCLKPDVGDPLGIGDWTPQLKMGHLEQRYWWNESWQMSDCQGVHAWPDLPRTASHASKTGSNSHSVGRKTLAITDPTLLASDPLL